MSNKKTRPPAAANGYEPLLEIKFTSEEHDIEGSVWIPRMLDDNDILVWNRIKERSEEDNARLEEKMTPIKIAFLDRLHMIRKWTVVYVEEDKKIPIPRKNPPYPIMQHVVTQTNRLIVEATKPPF